MSRVFWVYITIGDKQEAAELAEKLIRNRLAACVNIFDGIDSVYRWEGEIQTDREVAMVVKTTAARLGGLTEFVKQHHSYQCPCVVALAVEGGNPDFLSWVKEQVEPIERGDA